MNGGSTQQRGGGQTLLRFATLYLTALSVLDLILLLLLTLVHSLDTALVRPDYLLPFVYLLVGSAAAASFAGALYVYLAHPHLRRPLVFIVLVTLGIFVAHFYIINSPSTKDCFDSKRHVNGCAMDEVYYVPAAQRILSGQRCAPYADDCNLEHPFLSKAFVAAGIQLFGLNVFGWRFFQVVLGTLSIPVLFATCWVITHNKSFCYFAALFFALDTLFFVHSSIAVIDVQGIFFALLAFLFYFAKLKLWKLDRFVLAGVFLGLSGLSKETSLFFVLFLLTYELWLGGGNRASRILSSIKILAAVLVVFLGGLQIYDYIFTTSAIHSFADHLKFVLSYGASLTGNGWTDSYLHRPITPFDWMLFYSPVGYLITNVTVNNGPSYVGVGYYGITNKLETWMTFLWAPYVAYLILKRRRSPNLDLGDDFKLGVFVLVWYLWTYLPYIALFLYGRVTYPYYMIQAVPAIGIGNAYVCTRDWFPRIMAYVFLAAVFGWFFLYFPDKSFLPIWLRVILQR